MAKASWHYSADKWQSLLEEFVRSSDNFESVDEVRKKVYGIQIPWPGMFIIENSDGKVLMISTTDEANKAWEEWVEGFNGEGWEDGEDRRRH